MMATTHAFVGLAAAAAALPHLGDHVAAPVVLAAAFAGGLAPDADLLARHRKTLHFPVGATALALVGAAAFLVSSSSVALLATAFVGAAALHAVSDVLGGSAERAPWDPTTERGVYNHVLGRWHRPRRVVPYSGAPSDLLVALPFALAGIAAEATGPVADRAAALVLVGSACYVLVRKRLGALARLARTLRPS